MSKKFYIETFGCQMNINDSEMMTISMQGQGFSETDKPNEADIVIYNTCSVRKNAEDRASARIQESRAHAKKRKAIVVVTGCMAKRIGEDMINNNKVDIAIGPYQSPQIGDIVAEFYKDPSKRLYISDDKTDFKERLHPNLSNNKENAPWHKWVTITHGCENFCTYCIVPYVRGKLISFTSSAILEYIELLPGRGIKEITLLGQNVNQYGQDNNEIPFYKLLEKAAQINGIEKINFLTSHPKDFDLEIIKVIKDYENISKSIHLPLQSGSNTILKKMNRKYNVEHYMNIVNEIDKNLPDYALSTDLIVGFPGETEENYLETLELVKKIRFDEAYMYAYSTREGTAAANLPEQLDDNTKRTRLENLISIQREITNQKLEKRINKPEQIFVERVSKKSDNEVMGKSFLNHSVIIPGSASDIGKRIPVKITALKGSTLYGQRIV